MTKLIMSPGPTEVADSVLKAMAEKGTNPDLDPAFFDYYQKVSKKYSQLVGAYKGQSLILAGEAILGLEAACASLIHKGDKVLCLVNGFFGKGFIDFVKLYGGEPVVYESEWNQGLDIHKIESFLKDHKDIKLATMVHCETPTGITNPISQICPLLESRGMLTVVDSVSAVAGERINFDDDGIDVLLGGSQKCLSAPAGLTLVTLSQAALAALNANDNITGFYTNLAYFAKCLASRRFPYTMPQQNIYGLDKAIDNVLTTDFVEKHQRYADAVRKVFTENGFELYGKDYLSHTLTAIKVPDGINYDQLFSELLNEKVIIGGSLGELYGKVFRIGHMGENNHREKFEKLFIAMDKVFMEQGKRTELYKNFNTIKEDDLR